MSSSIFSVEGMAVRDISSLSANDQAALNAYFTASLTSMYTGGGAGQDFVEKTAGYFQTFAENPTGIVHNNLNLAHQVNAVHPTNWDEFVNGFKNYLLNSYAQLFLEPPIPLPSATMNAINNLNTSLLPAFTADYVKGLHVSQDPAWATLTPPIASAEDQFKTGFAEEFLPNLKFTSNTRLTPDPYVSPPTTAYGVDGFYNNIYGFFFQLGEALSPQVSLSSQVHFEATRFIAGVPATNVLQTVLPSYQDLFILFFPTGSVSDFNTRLQAFYTEQVAKNGYFNPSAAFLDWDATLRQAFSSTLLGNSGPTLGALRVSSNRLLILDRIYRLLAALLTSLQSVTAAQANRLIILSQWQKAYTDAISQLPVFLSSDVNSRLAGSGTDEQNARNDLNQYVNANFREILQNNRSIIGDDAKALQSSINQSNDAVSQQSNMATAIIQELSSLLNAIYR